MTSFPIQQVASLVHGQLKQVGKSSLMPEISSISIDSRTLVDADSCVFFALVGERHNGHNYLLELYEKGVRCFVVSDYPQTDSAFDGACFIVVEDTLQALQELAAYVRQQFQFPVLAITGSNGKTIVKEWLFELLVSRLKIARSPKSYNSQVGVPLSIWNMDGDFDLGIVEAGISKPSEMTRLANIIRPEIGLITNIGDAHQENFSSLEEKLEEKLQLFDGSELLIYRDDQPIIRKAVHEKFDSTSTKLFSWSTGDSKVDLFVGLKKEKQTTQLIFHLKGEKQVLTIPFTDEASIENTCHCLALIASQDWLNTTVAESFSNLQSVAMRLELKQGINNCILINDYYNSDINSLEIALQFLGQQTNSSGQRKTVVLSDFKQSGFQPEKLYTEVNRLLQLNQVSRLIGIGQDIQQNGLLFDLKAIFYNDTHDFLDDFDEADFKDEAILIKGGREFRFELVASVLQKKYHQTQLEISLNTLVENLNLFKAKLKPETRVMVMVKAFSYGSGTVEIARALEFQKVDYLAVAVADEGIELRQAGIETPIIVMNPEEHSFEAMIEYRLEPNIYSMRVFERFNKAARSTAVRDYPVHIKVETGMNRLGFLNPQELERMAEKIRQDGVLRVQSVFSHLAASDGPEHDNFTKAQYERFLAFAKKITSRQKHKVFLHLLNSAGIERFPEFQLDMVRLGIGLYGVSATQNLVVRPIARWTSAISQLKVVEQGETVGYSRMGKVDHPKKIAVVPVGYADGYDRRFSNGGAKMWVNGSLAPVIGNVCMDMTMIDVTGIDVEEGDLVELMGEHVHLNQLATWAGTIPYEILTGISQRVKRIYSQE
ncbi:MAG TPA: bifunctional UDP-N-acetylmuramoyl-tripeptide:D-alanyl-D-alanine ligase/alanine racemase [Sunxiuqinia sp.]|nr:bifunctional UDP-N-acetylmuramoyl-tripeptide:D-alanyl-D-alanine ligase/alanine racemase [Sunxiuqinia sp.]